MESDRVLLLVTRHFMSPTRLRPGLDTFQALTAADTAQVQQGQPALCAVVQTDFSEGFIRPETARDRQSEARLSMLPFV